MDTLVCGECQSELEVVCPKGHAVTNDSVDRRRPRVRGSIDARVYQDKACRRCGRLFHPTGPRALYCGRQDCSNTL